MYVFDSKISINVGCIHVACSFPIQTNLWVVLPSILQCFRYPIKIDLLICHCYHGNYGCWLSGPNFMALITVYDHNSRFTGHVPNSCASCVSAECLVTWKIFPANPWSMSGVTCPDSHAYGKQNHGPIP